MANTKIRAIEEFKSLLKIEKKLWKGAENGKGYYYSVNFGGANQCFDENPLENLFKFLRIRPKVIPDV